MDRLLIKFQVLHVLIVMILPHCILIFRMMG